MTGPEGCCRRLRRAVRATMVRIVNARSISANRPFRVAQAQPVRSGGGRSRPFGTEGVENRHRNFRLGRDVRLEFPYARRIICASIISLSIANAVVREVAADSSNTNAYALQSRQYLNTIIQHRRLEPEYIGQTSSTIPNISQLIEKVLSSIIGGGIIVAPEPIEFPTTASAMHSAERECPRISTHTKTADANDQYYNSIKVQKYVLSFKNDAERPLQFVAIRREGTWIGPKEYLGIPISAEATFRAYSPDNCEFPTTSIRYYGPKGSYDAKDANHPIIRTLFSEVFYIDPSYYFVRIEELSDEVSMLNPTDPAIRPGRYLSATRLHDGSGDYVHLAWKLHR
jgi:hypothetical protein